MILTEKFKWIKVSSKYCDLATGCFKKLHTWHLSNFSRNIHAGMLAHITSESWDPQLRLEYKNISVQYQGAKI